MKFKRRINWMLYALLAVIVAACGGGDSDGVVGTGFGDPADNAKPFTISGAAQKGPFIKGTRVLINRLTNLAEGTYETTVGEIDDNLGNFRFTYKGIGPVLIEADGVHFNEVTGQLSNSQLRLRAIYNVNSNPEQHAYINVLTHLAYGQIQKLIRSGTPIDDAIKQGEAAVIESLQPVLPVANVADFTELSLFDTDQSRAISNAYLLALSATVAQYAIEKQKANQNSPVESELTYLLDNLSYSIADTGRIDNANVIANLKNAARMLRPDQIRANLAKRSVDTTKFELPVANLDLFLDTDGDGVLNLVDTDDDNDGIPDAEDSTPYVFTPALSLRKPSTDSVIPSLQDVTFEWSSPEDPAQVEMQVADNDAFSGDVKVLTSAGAVVSTRFDLAGEYYLKARGKNSFGRWGAWGDSVKVSVGKFETTMGGNNIDSALSESISSMVSTPDGSTLVRSTTPAPGLATHYWLSKLDGLGKVVWRQSIDSFGNLGYSNRVELTLDDGKIVFPSSFDRGAGLRSFTVLDKNGVIIRTVSVSLGKFDVYAWSDAVLLNGSVFFVYLGKCGSYWYQCIPIASEPVLVRLDPATGETELKPLTGFGDLSRGSPAFATGSGLPRCCYSEGIGVVRPPIEPAEKVAPWDLILALRKFDGNNLLLTFSNKFETNCGGGYCVRTGLAVFDVSGKVNWMWLSNFLSTGGPQTSTATSKNSIFLSEFVIDGNNGRGSNYLYSMNLADKTVTMYPDVELYGGFRASAFTRSGSILLLPYLWPNSGSSYILKFDMAQKSSTQVAVPCTSNLRCWIVDFSSTSDGGAIFGVKHVKENGDLTMSKIVKWMDADQGQ